MKGRHTKHNDMYSGFVKSLSDRISHSGRPVVRVVDDDLSSAFEKVPYQLLTAFRDLLSQSDRLGALVTCESCQYRIRCQELDEG